MLINCIVPKGGEIKMFSVKRYDRGVKKARGPLLIARELAQAIDASTAAILQW